MHTHICKHTRTHTHAHTHKHTHTQTHTHTHTQEQDPLLSVTVQVPVKQIFTTPPSSSKRTTLTIMHPVEDTTDHIDPMEITTNRLSWN